MDSEFLWMDGWDIPCWVSEELRRRPKEKVIFTERGNPNEKNPKENISFISLLKTCTKMKDLSSGIRLHDDILKKGLLEKNPYLASTLINMYAKCGSLTKAQKVLEELPSRDVVTWSALIAGYAKDGQGHQALNCFEKMQREGLSPDAITFTCILKACGSIGAIEKGKEIHEEILSRGFLEKDMVLANALVDMYAKCGTLSKAEEVLKVFAFQNNAAWNALIAGFVQYEQYDEAFSCLDKMRSEGPAPDALTFSSILKACGSVRYIDKGKQIHDEIIRKGLLEKNIVLGTALVDMYAKCGEIAKAREMLRDLPIQDVVSWSALISGYAQLEKYDEALECFEQMKSEGVSPNEVTFISVLKACGNDKAINIGKQVHNEILSRGYLKGNTMLGNTLVDMYAKCGSLTKAHQVLENLPVQNVVSWNALITGYAQQERFEEALYCFERMQSEGISPDTITFICMLKVHGCTCNIDKGKQIHEEIVSRGLLKKDVVLGTALVDMYAKCNMVAKSLQVLEDLHIRDVVSWSALIAGYIQQGQCHEALSCFEEMQLEGISPNSVTFICSLNACGSTGALLKGEEIHDDIVSRGLLKKDIELGNALVDMYVKCGILDKAKRVLEELPIRNVVSWNALIAGYAQQGKGHEALNCFKTIEREGLSPDEVTFLCVLSACSHSGLLHEAQMLFGSMTKTYGIVANIGHHTCMVVVFACAGQFDNAISVMKAMPSSDDTGLWIALLGACRKWGNVKLGKLSFDQIIQLEDSFAAAYVLMANIFATAGMQKDAEKVEAMRLKYATDRNQGNGNSVYVNVNGKVHSFS